MAAELIATPAHATAIPLCHRLAIIGSRSTNPRAKAQRISAQFVRTKPPDLAVNRRVVGSNPSRLSDYSPETLRHCRFSGTVVHEIPVDLPRSLGEALPDRGGISIQTREQIPRLLTERKPQIWRIVLRIPDRSADSPCLHPLGRKWAQEVDRWPVGISGVKPSVIV